MAKKDKIAIFGGTFNPPHNGHLHLLAAFREQIAFDKTLILPTAVPPHKQAKQLATGEQRLTMCRLALPDCEVCDYEIRRGGKNYTADTLAYLKTQYPQAQFYFIMGTDMLLSFHTWHEPERVLENAILLCDSRDEITSPAELRRFAKETLGLADGQYIISDVKPLPLSSSEVRERVGQGEDIGELVPAAVARFIQKEGLYER